MPTDVTRLELSGIRTCTRCGRGRAELTASDGRTLTVSLDAVRARELTGGTAESGVQPLTQVVLVQLTAAGLVPKEIVFDTAAGALRALLSVVRGEDVDVIACTPQEGLGLAVRGSLGLYATDEALAQVTVAHEPGPETLH